MTKSELLKQIDKLLQDNNLLIENSDLKRPWGAFWYIAKDSLNIFLKLFFPNYNNQNQNISPKILLVEPNKRLSLQLHHRRSEKWFVIKGPVKIILGKEELILNDNQTLTIPSGTPHRLCGLENHGIVAEIWIHNDPQNPSDENDIVRLEDDFNRLN